MKRYKWGAIVLTENDEGAEDRALAHFNGVTGLRCSSTKKTNDGLLVRIVKWDDRSSLRGLFPISEGVDNDIPITDIRGEQDKQCRNR